MKQNITTAISFLLILLFLYTGMSKLIDHGGFVSDLNNQPFPDSWTPVLSWLVPAVEIITAAFLFFEKTTTAGLVSSIVLMGAFTIYTILVLIRVFPYVPCSCGGVIGSLTWGQHLIFNLFFLLVSLAAIMIKNFLNLSCMKQDKPKTCITE